MKAKEENGQIKRYTELPKYYKHWAGGFDTQSTATHEAEGFFDVVFPEIDLVIEKLGDIYFNVNVFTYPVIEKILPTLADAKTAKKMQLKYIVKDLYSSIQWYANMKLDNDEALPQAFIDKRNQIKNAYLNQKSNIDNLNTVVEVLKYEFPTAAIEAIKTQLDSIE